MKANAAQMQNNLAVKASLILGQVVALAMIGCGKKNNDSLARLSEAAFITPPQTVSVEIQNYNPQPGYQFENLFVFNNSVVVSKGKLEFSNSRDGMTDSLKQSLAATYGFTLQGPESALPNFADLLLFNLGVNKAQQSLMYCSAGQSLSSTNDAIIYNDSRIAGSPIAFIGLRDCEKIYMGLNPNQFDNDNDGIADYLELRCGLNPLNKSDAFVSTAGDSLSNLEKCKEHIPVTESADTVANQLYAYKYATTVNANLSKNFAVTNIAVLNDQNLLTFYIVEINPATQQRQIYTAYSIVSGKYFGLQVKIPYWAKSAATFRNQEIVLP